jgi:hypothetical protein
MPEENSKNADCHWVVTSGCLLSAAPSTVSISVVSIYYFCNIKKSSSWGLPPWRSAYEACCRPWVWFPERNYSHLYYHSWLTIAIAFVMTRELGALQPGGDPIPGGCGSELQRRPSQYRRLAEACAPRRPPLSNLCKCLSVGIVSPR